MKVIFAAGGTGGHINPALAAAGELRRRHPDAEILFIGCKAVFHPLQIIAVAHYDCEIMLAVFGF